MYLTKDVVLGYLTQEAIFQHYMGMYIDVNALYRNPLRADEHPKCQFKRGDNGVLYFMDYSPKSRLSVDCFGLVQRMFNLDFLDSLRRIAKDFDLHSIYEGSKKKPDWMLANEATKGGGEITLNETTYDFSVREWNIVAMRFWSRALPQLKPDNLMKKGVYLIDDLYINNSLIREDKLIFVYKLTDDFRHYQFYKPTRFIRGNKHISVTDRSLFFTERLDRSKSYCFIIKSVKDYVCGTELDSNVCCLLSENLLTHHIDIEIMNQLIEDFDYVFTLFDNDRAGKVASIQYKRMYGTIPLMFPKTMQKDIYDNLIAGNKSEIDNSIAWIKRRYDL